MTTKKLSKLIDKALKKPPDILMEICGEWYQPYYHLMYLLAKNIKSGVAVELGVHIGRGVGSMAAGNPELRIIGFDTVHDERLDLILRRFPNIVFHQLPSLPAKEWLPKISLLHVDTEHSYSMAKTEFEAHLPYLAPGAFVLFDDLNAMNCDVQKYFNSLNYEKIQDDRLHPICGYGVAVISQPNI